MYFKTKFNGILIKGVKYKLPFTIYAQAELTNTYGEPVKTHKMCEKE